MSNTSATSGYLTPTSAPVLQEAFEDALQEMVVGITGLPGRMVRPRFQERPPSRPKKNDDWCAVGITDTSLTSHTFTVHNGSDDGRTFVISTDQVEVMATFYGPNSRDIASRLRDGLHLGQNRAVARMAGVVVSEIGSPRNVPEMVAQTWVPRVDLPMTVQWETRQTYGVLNLLNASGGLVADSGQTRGITSQQPQE